MKTPFLQFKSALVILLITAIFFALEGAVAYSTERVVETGTFSCNYVGVVANYNATGILANFKCGDETMTLHMKNSLAIITNGIKTTECKRFQGSRSHDVTWDCNLPKE